VGVAHDHGAVRAGAGQQRAVRAVGEAFDLGHVPGQRLPQSFAAGWVEQDYGAVAPAGSQGLAVGREGDRLQRLGDGIDSQRVALPASLEKVPNRQTTVAVVGRKEPAIGTERQCGDDPRVGWQAADLACGVGVDQPNLPGTDWFAGGGLLAPCRRCGY
jgi:hypothetical protein